MNEILDMQFLLNNMFAGNKKRMLRIVTDGLVKAKKINDLRLVALIVADLKLIREL